MENTKATPWFDIYSIIGKTLNNFFNKHGYASGEVLLNRLLENEEYVNNNNWIKKFSGLKTAIDPMHILASISDVRLKKENRIKRINLFYEALFGPDLFKKVLDIDMEGCPQPYTSELTSFRSPKDETRVWQEFNKIYEGGVEGLQSNMFRGPDKWLGIGGSLFSLFICWIRPDSFMPLDKYTLNFLDERGKINGVIDDLDKYKKILTAEDEGTYRLIYSLSHDSKKISDLSPGEFIQYKSYFSINTDKFKVDLEAPSNKCRVLAIRTLKGCDVKFSKSIKEGVLYKFYDDFEEDGDRVYFDRDCDRGLYNTDGLKFNVSAIAGRNGTGKSTLLELLVIGLNNLAYSRIKANGVPGTLKPVGDVYLEFYFETDSIYKAVIKNEVCYIQKYSSLGGTEYREAEQLDFKDFDFRHFFYTILINYSLHGLNSDYFGPWLNNLFHKNDGYQIPAVIEPYRVRGNIDINRQELLAKQRLLSNLLELEDEDDSTSLRRIKGNVKAKYIRLTKAFEEDKRDRSLADKPDEIIRTLFSMFEIKNVDFIISYEYDDVVDVAKIYLIRKLHTIASRYSEYKEYLDSNKKLVCSGRKLKEFIVRIHSDTSHITYKVRQVLNFLKYPIYSKVLDQTLEIDQVAKDISYVVSSDEHKKIEYFLPPSFFKVDILLGGNGEVNFSSLSSGEKQKIYVMNSILYHVRNIDSVYEGGVNKISKYGYVNLFLDEIELCFHPELQRTFVDDLLNLLSRRPLLSIYGINICFVTHSPFILSDIPGTSILFLDNDSSDESGLKSIPCLNMGKTFAANIHDLLANGFFMGGSIGVFSEKCITEIVDLYDDINKGKDLERLMAKYLKEKERYYFVLDSISDGEINGILSNYIQNIELHFKIEPDKNVEIARLEEELRLLKSDVGLL